MTESNVSNSTSGTEPSSAFQSAHSALARKPLPGPQWAWPALAAAAIAGVAYLVAGTSGEHVAHRAPAASAEGAPHEGAEPTTTTAALQPQAPAAAPTSPPAAPAPAPVNDVTGSAAKAEAEPAKAEAGPAKAEAEPAKASDDTEQAVASAPSATKKKKARRAKRRKPERSEQ